MSEVAVSGVLTLADVADVLNADLVPRVPRIGSLGASGDLAPSGHAFLPLVGEGEVEDAAGERLSGAEALRRLGADPLRLESKEGIALVNGTHFMAGWGALLARDAADVLDCADVALAAAVDALRGCTPAFEERVHALRPVAGQAHVAANVRALIAGSQRTTAGTPERVQDPYCLRCGPQIHGSAREALRFFTELVAADVDAVTDNPLLFDGDVVSAGNFHGQSLALAFDVLRLGLADIAAVVERRIHTLLFPPPAARLPLLLTADPGLSAGYMVVQNTAVALLAELRSLAGPVSIDSVPTAGNQEDHVSMGMTGAWLTAEAIDRLRRALAAELLCSCQALDADPDGAGGAGSGVRTLHALVREQVAPLGEDRPADGDLERLTELIASGAVGTVLRSVSAGG